MEYSKGLKILNAKLEEYKNEMVLMARTPEGCFEIEEHCGKAVIVASKHYCKVIKEYFVKRSVFVVHGRDKRTAESVAHFIENEFSFDCTILDEKANSGMTVIEKLEKYSEAKFAVVLLTPDDQGRLVSEKGKTLEKKQKLKTRARQNVIFEMGLFHGLIGRENVIGLNKGVEEIPSDLGGVILIFMDDKEAWKRTLQREISTIVQVG